MPRLPASLDTPEDLPEVTAPAPPSRASGSEDTPEQTAAKTQLRTVTTKLLELTAKLPTASDEDIEDITLEIQRYRVAMMTLREIVNDLADPTTYRELTLLNKMLAAKGQVPEGEPTPDAVDAEEAARERIREAGFNPDSAASMVRALEALKAVSARMPTTVFVPPREIQ